MIAVVVLSVGLLGMAAMTIMVIRGNRMAVRQTNATNLAQQLLERLKDVNFSLLGGQSPACAGVLGSGVKLTQGIFDTVCIDSSVNAQGIDVATGPVYDLFLNVCNSASPAQTVTVPAPRDNYCLTAPSSVVGNESVPQVPELACAGNLNAGEIQLLVVVSWRDQGDCHHVDLPTLIVDL